MFSKNIISQALLTLFICAGVHAEQLVGTSTTCSPLSEVGCSGAFPYRDNGLSEVADIPTERDSLAYRLQTLKGAKKSIRIQALIFTGDETGLRVAEILKQKKKQGLDVRVIVDAFSNLAPNTQSMYYGLLREGIDIEGYEPGTMKLLNEFSAKDASRTNKRFHEKMWIIDAEGVNGIAVVGGLNIANEYFQVGKVAKEIWRDQDVAVRGEVVSDIAKAFDSNWKNFKDFKNQKHGVFSAEHMRYFIKKAAEANPGSMTESNVEDPYGKAFGKDFLDADKINMVLQAEQTKLNLEFKASPMRFIQNRPRLQESYITQQYLHEIENAKEQIVIVNAYFVPTPELQEAIRVATSVRHVPVYIVTNSPETNDLPIMAYVARTLYAEMFGKTLDEQKANSFLHMYEWQGNKFNMGTLHAKYAVFDKMRVIVGSFNLDPRSRNLNSESVLFTESENLAGRFLSRLLNQDMAKTVGLNLERALAFRTTDTKTKSQAAIGMQFLSSY
jgi:putative cardiolipin synthase